MNLTCVWPTVQGREASLLRAIAAVPDAEHLIYHDRPTCGEAWVQGAREATGDYVWFAADDVEAHEGFAEAMIEAVEAGKHPAAVVLEPDGMLQSCGGRSWDCCKRHCEDWTVVDWSPTPFFRRDQWALLEPHADTLADLLYCSDMIVSEIFKRAGIPPVVRTPAVLTHHNHPVRRGGDMGDQHERTARDRAAFRRWLDL